MENLFAIAENIEDREILILISSSLAHLLSFLSFFSWFIMNKVINMMVLMFKYLAVYIYGVFFQYKKLNVISYIKIGKNCHIKATLT